MTSDEIIETMVRAIERRCEPFSHVPKKLAASILRDALSAAEAAGSVMVLKTAVDDLARRAASAPSQTWASVPLVELHALAAAGDLE